MSGRIIKGDKSGIEADTKGLGEFFFYSAEIHGDKICQLDAVTGKQESYRSVKERSTRVAIHLRKLGLTPDDVVLLCIGNTLDAVIPVLSALYLGAKFACLDGSLAVRDCAHCISLVKPKFIFVEEASLHLMEDGLKQAKLTSTLIVVGKSEKYKTLSELQESTPEEKSFRPVKVDCHETAIIYFSSGTTGMPKGICATHFGFLHNTKAAIATEFVDPSVISHISSLYWISATCILTTTFLTGGCRVLLRKFDAEETLRIIEKYKVTSIFLAPIYTHYLVDVKDAEKYDTSSLRSLVLGGTPLSATQLQRTRKLFKNTFVFLGYGTTEAVGFVAAFSYTKDQHFLNKYGSSGKCICDTEIKIVDIEKGNILGPNQKGEICVRSPYISPGYYKNPAPICDEEGFLKTGDIGYYDEDECIYIIDRIKEMFKYQSWHVVPSFLEGVLQEHPCVREAAVYGIPHDVDEFWPAALVVLKDGAQATEEDIGSFYSPKVARWHQLRGGIKIVKAIPKGPTGKLQRWKLRESILNSVMPPFC